MTLRVGFTPIFDITVEYNQLKSYASGKNVNSGAKTKILKALHKISKIKSIVHKNGPFGTCLTAFRHSFCLKSLHTNTTSDLHAPLWLEDAKPSDVQESTKIP